MSTAVAMIAVGLVSYLFRVAPLLTVGRLRLRPGVLRTIRHGGAGAVSALFVLSLNGSGHGGVDPALVVAAATALWLAVRGAPMLRIVATGAATYTLIEIAVRLVQLGRP